MWRPGYSDPSETGGPSAALYHSVVTILRKGVILAISTAGGSQAPAGPPAGLSAGRQSGSNTHPPSTPAGLGRALILFLRVLGVQTSGGALGKRLNSPQPRCCAAAAAGGRNPHLLAALSRMQCMMHVGAFLSGCFPTPNGHVHAVEWPLKSVQGFQASCRRRAAWCPSLPACHLHRCRSAAPFLACQPKVMTLVAYVSVWDKV